MAEKEESSGSLWLVILRVLWDMRWRFLGFAALLVGIHFALQYGDVLFPHRRSWTDVDTLLAILFGGMIFWGYSADTRKRMDELEKRVEGLEATKPERADQ